MLSSLIFDGFKSPAVQLFNIRWKGHFVKPVIQSIWVYLKNTVVLASVMMVMSRPLVKAAVQMLPVRLYRARLMQAAMASVGTMATSTMPLRAALKYGATPVANKIIY